MALASQKLFKPCSPAIAFAILHANAGCIAINMKGPVQEMHDGWVAHVLVGAVHLHQQRHVAGGVLARKGGCRCTKALGQGRSGQAVTLPASHQPGQLGSAVAAGVTQVGQ